MYAERSDTKPTGYWLWCVFPDSMTDWYPARDFSTLGDVFLHALLEAIEANLADSAGSCVVPAVCLTRNHGSVQSWIAVVSTFRSGQSGESPLAGVLPAWSMKKK